MAKISERLAKSFAAMFTSISKICGLFYSHPKNGESELLSTSPDTAMLLLPDAE